IAPFLAALDEQPSLVAIDMPIGFSNDAPRACDVAARTLLGAPRGSSVFPAPIRHALPAETYREACAWNIQACGKALSRQGFALFPKLRELDAVMSPERQRWVREAHPELIFATLAGGGRGLASSKRTPAGLQERLMLLARNLPDLSDARLAAERRRLG